MNDLTSGTVTDVLFAGSMRIGEIQGGLNYYYHLDRLGSVRLVTQTANIQNFVTKYLPSQNSHSGPGLYQN